MTKKNLRNKKKILLGKFILYYLQSTYMEMLFQASLDEYINYEYGVFSFMFIDRGSTEI